MVEIDLLDPRRVAPPPGEKISLQLLPGPPRHPRVRARAEQTAGAFPQPTVRPPTTRVAPRPMSHAKVVNGSGMVPP